MGPAATASQSRREFGALPWRGAMLLDFRLERRGPAAARVDQVILSLVWPDGRHCLVSLREAHALEASLALGADAPETVRSAAATAPEPGAQARLSAQSGPVELTCFTVRMSGPGGVLRVYAREWGQRLVRAR